MVDLQDKCVNLLVEAGAKSLQGCERLLNGAPDHSGLVPAGPRSGLDIGAAFAAGVRLRAGRFAIVPEFRYVRWSSQNSLNRHNEAGFLLGLSF